MAAAWADSAPSDEALATVVYELRRAFDDEARAPRVIETIRKRGIRIVAPVKPVVSRSRGPDRIRRWRMTVGAVIAAVLVTTAFVALDRALRQPRPEDPSLRPPTIRSLAVLPFTTLTSYDEDLLAAALGEMLIADLDQACSADISPAIAVREREVRYGYS